MQIRGVVEKLLTALGAEVVPVADSHLCCGSAGTYSVLQPKLSTELKQRKLGALEQQSPELILSANVGCITHLQSGTQTPVQHWIEWVDQRLTP
jgi:glycolate oxidase iron-sulfur subunit